MPINEQWGQIAMADLWGIMWQVLLAIKGMTWQLLLALRQHIFAISTVLAELVVALVIYFEVQASIIYHALEAIYQQPFYHNRGTLYSSFLSVEARNLTERQNRFLLVMKQDKNVLRNCDDQVSMYTKLGYLLRPRGLRRLRIHSWAGYGPRHMIGFFPHAVAPLAVMSLAYIRERRQDKGPTWGHHFIGLAIACLRETKYREIKLHGESQDKCLIITSQELKETAEELKKLWAADGNPPKGENPKL